MVTDTSEKGLETLIVESLVYDAGYQQGESSDYDRDHAVDLTKLLAFLKATQPKAVETLELSDEPTLKLCRPSTPTQSGRNCRFS